MNKLPRPHWRASKEMQQRARELRREMTPAEKDTLKEKVQGELEAVALEIVELEGLTQPIPPLQI